MPSHFRLIVLLPFLLAQLGAAPDSRKHNRHFEYTLDTAHSPHLRVWAETKLRPEIDKWYPILCESLASEGFTAPRKFAITIKPTDGVAGTNDTDVTVNSAWVEEQLRRPDWNEAAGAVIHELAHVVQQYKGSGNPGWLVEGVADYHRWFHYEPLAHRPKLQDRNAKYSDSYQTTAGFLEYVVKNHNHEFVVRMNAAMREGRYHQELWHEYTGQTVQELWDEYSKSVLSPPANVNKG